MGFFKKEKQFKKMVYMEPEMPEEADAEELEYEQAAQWNMEQQKETDPEEACIEDEEIEDEKTEAEDLTPDIPSEDVLQEQRRKARHKRRKNNEILVSLTSVMILLMVVCLTYAGVYTAKDFVEGIKKDKEIKAETTDHMQELVDSMFASETELPTEIVEVVPAEQLFEEYIDTVIAGMTLEEKVAGLFIATPEQLTGVNTAVRAGEGTKAALEELPIGGIVYYRKNIESEQQIQEMLANTVAYSKYPMFLAVNEGGDTASSVQNSVIEVPKVTTPANIKSDAEAYELGQTIGAYLSALNFNVNFAPTADILYEKNAAIAGYTFGGDADMNGGFVAEFVKGLQEQGVSAAVKTFPGTGHLTASTTNTTVSTNKTREAYEADFAVFKAGIDAGTDFIMVSNIVASELSGGMEPCSMSSSVVTDILRGELGFGGIIITEPMNGKAITDYYSASEAAVAALKAGCDMILMPENLKQAYQGVLEGIANGSVAEARVNDSLKRVFRVKYADKLAEFEQETGV